MQVTTFFGHDGVDLFGVFLSLISLKRTVNLDDWRDAGFPKVLPSSPFINCGNQQHNFSNWLIINFNFIILL